MAIQSSNLKVSIRETITINSNKYDAFTNQTITGISEVSKRVLNIPTASQEIISISGSIGSGTYITEDVKYIRISNLNDSSNAAHVDLTFRSFDNDEFAVRLDYGSTFMYPATIVNGVSGSMDSIDAGEANLSQMASLKNVVAKASGSNVDLELFIASS